MSTWLAAGLAAAAVTLTYFGCIRPMHRSSSCRPGAEPAGVEHELAELGAQLRSLQRQADIESTQRE